MTVQIPASAPLVRHGVVQGLVAAWVAVWVVTGVVAVMEIRDLAAYSRTLSQSGDALDTAGSALQLIGALPVVGDGPERLGDEVRATAVDIRESAEQTRSSVHSLSVLLGLSIVFIPTVPVLAAYVPLRVRSAREVRAVRAALADSSGEPGFEEFLARRAVQNLSFQALRAVTPTPWKDLEAGRYRRLANAELTRLGIAEPGGIDVERLRRRQRPGRRR